MFTNTKAADLMDDSFMVSPFGLAITAYSIGVVVSREMYNIAIYDSFKRFWLYV